MAKKPDLDLSALDNFSALDLDMNNGNFTPVSDGRPLQLSLDQILEDPNQPRVTFEDSTLKELAASICQVGVLQPISVRPNPATGGYIINYGARRYRAAKMAKLAAIPAFVEDSQNKYGQMAENLHRDNLSALEIAAFISEEVQSGRRKGDIAKGLGKSAAWLSQYARLADAPDWIKTLCKNGKCSDVTTLNELVKLAEKMPNIQEKVSGLANITRAEVQAMAKEPQTESSPYTEQSAGELVAPVPSLVTEEVASGYALVTDGDSGDDFSAHRVPGSSGRPKEPDLEYAIFIGGRKAYLQTRKVQVWWDDTGEFESIAITDLPTDALEK